jgi:plasmid maintenance system antidote protein VapI
MTHEELNHFFMLKRKKGITNKAIAQAIGASEALISFFFSGKCNVSPEKEMAIKKYITETDNFTICNHCKS